MNFIDKQFGRLGNRLFQSAFIYALYRKEQIPDIYLQDPKYFDDYRSEIRQLFKQEGEPLDYVSIHVRRGDYVGNPFYVDLTETDYYKKAMEQFPGDEFVVYSDDPAWVEKQGVFAKCFISYQSELEDFNSMARCKGHVIANSSFSWWAAYLSGNKTVAPKEWFRDGIKRVGIPTEWIQI